MNFKIITPPTQVIDLDRARLQCKITGNDRDADVTDAIAGARDYAEVFLGVPVGDQVREYSFLPWCGRAVLPCDVTELQTVTVAGVPVTPLTGLLVDRTLTLSTSWPATVVVRIRCGYTSATLPGTVKSAMLLLIADLVRNPQSQSETQLYRNHAFDALLWPHRERLPL